jgi:hypothetical protein
MKTTDSLSRMNSVAARKLVIEIRGAADTGLTVEAGLLNAGEEGTVLHATTVLKAGWPDEVVEAVKTLTEAVEMHLLQVHFVEDERDRRQKDGDHLPPSIIAELGDTPDTIHQL